MLQISNAPLCTVPLLGGVSGPILILAVLSLLTLAYCAISGLYGVVYTDVFQFLFAMVGCIALP